MLDATVGMPFFLPLIVAGNVSKAVGGWVSVWVGGRLCATRPARKEGEGREM